MADVLKTKAINYITYIYEKGFESLTFSSIIYLFFLKKNKNSQNCINFFSVKLLKEKKSLKKKIWNGIFEIVFSLLPLGVKYY